MTWKYYKETTDLLYFECTDINKVHNHGQITTNDEQNLLECELIPDSIRNEAINYYIEGFTVKQLQMMINSTHKN
ncbi:unnamed protein product [Blepharisma stoltei]|uniref:Uncharacterized protein n=1 Tax=Blepharisma stoltei TaxID=1481888 RepID=A0AAU9JA64_9CILI|nr:unnamed protein product [Blepharisma stoltei]